MYHCLMLHVLFTFHCNVQVPGKTADWNSSKTQCVTYYITEYHDYCHLGMVSTCENRFCSRLLTVKFCILTIHGLHLCIGLKQVMYIVKVGHLGLQIGLVHAIPITFVALFTSTDSQPIDYTSIWHCLLFQFLSLGQRQDYGCNYGQHQAVITIYGMCRLTDLMSNTCQLPNMIQTC